MLAPFQVPRIIPPFITNFIFDVPDTTVELCYDISEAGIIILVMKHYNLGGKLL